MQPALRDVPLFTSLTAPGPVERAHWSRPAAALPLGRRPSPCHMSWAGPAHEAGEGCCPGCTLLQLGTPRCMLPAGQERRGGSGDSGLTPLPVLRPCLGSSSRRQHTDGWWTESCQAARPGTVCISICPLLSAVCPETPGGPQLPPGAPGRPHGLSRATVAPSIWPLCHVDEVLADLASVLRPKGVEVVSGKGIGGLCCAPAGEGRLAWTRAAGRCTGGDRTGRATCGVQESREVPDGSQHFPDGLKHKLSGQWLLRHTGPGVVTSRPR